MSTLFLGSGTI